MKTPYTIPKEVSHVTKTLENKGFEAFLVGGCVRDLLLGKAPKDWDVTTNARPEDIVDLFAETFYENDYGTVGVVQDDAEDPSLKVIEVTPYRKEGVYSDRRRPDSVSFEATLKDDLQRRDFTINAIALSVEKGTFVDPYGGREDIEKKTIKAVGNPDDRFNEDALRLLRAVRLHAEIGFTLEKDTEKAILNNAKHLKGIAKERIRDEFTRIVLSPQPMEGLIMLKKLALLSHIIPEFEETYDVEQNKAHSFDVWTHLIRSLQHTADKKWPLHVRLAALFHDIGKPASRRKSKETGEWTFYGHEVIGAKMTRKILMSLKFPKEITETVVTLVRWHMFFSDTETITHSAVRRMVARVGKDLMGDLMHVRAADRIGTGRPKENPYRLRKYKAMIEEVLRDPVSVGMLAVDGSILMEELKITPGPILGYLLHALLNEVLEDPTINTKEVLLERARELVKLSPQELKALGEKGKDKKEEEEEKHVKNIRKKHWVE